MTGVYVTKLAQSTTLGEADAIKRKGSLVISDIWLE